MGPEGRTARRRQSAGETLHQLHSFPLSVALHQSLLCYILVLTSRTGRGPSRPSLRMPADAQIDIFLLLKLIFLVILTWIALYLQAWILFLFVFPNFYFAIHFTRLSNLWTSKKKRRK